MKGAAVILGILLAAAAHAEQPAAPADAPAAPAAQEQRTPKVVEIDASAAYSFLVSSRTSNGTTLSRRNGGPGGAVSALLRTGYFLSPFLDLSFHPLLASTDRFDLDAALGGPVVLRSSLLAFSIVAGAAYDISRLRLRAGLGWADVMVRSRSGSLRTSEWDMSYFASASAMVWKAEWLRVGIEGRAGIINDAGISFVTIGLVAGSDVFRWPRDH